MPYIAMPNQTKVFVNEDYYHQPEVHFSALLQAINGFGNTVEHKTKACRILGALGVLGSDAISSLENIIYSANDITLVQAALSALERIAPKYRHDPAVLNGVQGRINLLRHQQAAAAAPVVVEPKKKSLNMIDIIQADDALDEGVKVSRKCNFCEKETVAQPEVQRLAEKLCAQKKFYCNFCLRHSLHTKDNRHTLMLSFRAIFGYFYYEFYHHPKSPQMYLSEIQDYIDLHRDIGLNNPVFSFDPESYVWFVDFRRVGTGKKKISIEDVQKTVIDILASFNLAQTVTGCDLNKLYQKYREAIDDFYTKRYRPEGKRLLIPTLKGCGNVLWMGTAHQGAWAGTVANQPQPQRMTLEDTKGFLPPIIDPSKYWQKTAAI
jgi:hypothetical protein